MERAVQLDWFTIPVLPADLRDLEERGFKVVKKLGQGSFGKVYQVKAMKLKGTGVAAAKVLELSKMDRKLRYKFLPRELRCQVEARHPNLIQTHYIYKSREKIVIIMEFAPFGDLAKYTNSNDGVEERQAAIWFLQSTNGLYYLHEVMRTAHRDLKCENIMIGQNRVAKLIDFGFARKVKASDESNSGSNSSKQTTQLSRTCNSCLSSTFCGTRAYNCPSKLARKSYDPFKSDVWSMGIVLYYMLHNRFPFHYDNIQRELSEITDYPRCLRSRFRTDSRSDCDDEWRSLIEKLLNPNEAKRCSLDEILSHGWLQDKATRKQSSIIQRLNKQSIRM